VVSVPSSPGARRPPGSRSPTAPHPPRPQVKPSDDKLRYLVDNVLRKKEGMSADNLADVAVALATMQVRPPGRRLPGPLLLLGLLPPPAGAAGCRCWQRLPLVVVLGCTTQPSSQLAQARRPMRCRPPTGAAGAQLVRGL
jgi:hypothetical protein